MIRRSSDSNVEMLDEADSPVEDLEQGTLAIQINVRTKTDIWKRPTPRFHQKNDGIVTPWLTFEIPFARILPAAEPDNIIRSSHHYYDRLPSTPASSAVPAPSANTKRYVVYDINVRQDANTPDGFDHNPASIERRYTHFLRLYEALRAEFPDRMRSVAFPKKAIMGNFSAELVAARSASFETFLDHVAGCSELRDSRAFLNFLQDSEVQLARRLLDERRNEQAVPILENCFRLLNRVYTDKASSVLLMLCRLVAACTTPPMPHPAAQRWCELALHRYETVSDADSLVLYVPLLQTCLHLYWQRGCDNAALLERMQRMQMQGVNTKAPTTLTQAIQAMEARPETM